MQRKYFTRDDDVTHMYDDVTHMYDDVTHIRQSRESTLQEKCTYDTTYKIKQRNVYIIHHIR